MTPSHLIAQLGLQPHPEGGHYRETWRADTQAGRASGSCIYFLLQAGEVSHWHRVDAAEIWHFYSGAPIILSTSKTLDGPKREQVLGPNLGMDQAPQIIVPAGCWQSCRSTGAYTLVGCTVSPAFQFEGFELAPPDVDIV
ncbi:cupin domain-containing protein [Poseidonocella pacifica]|nr:cupin domain-containing protein [Poseidonocella pacifica]